MRLLKLSAAAAAVIAAIGRIARLATAIPASPASTVPMATPPPRKSHRYTGSSAIWTISSTGVAARSRAARGRAGLAASAHFLSSSIGS